MWNPRRPHAGACPVNNRKIAETRVALSERDLASVAAQYKITRALRQYHSALEHTFPWIMDAEDPYLIEQFCIATGMASFNHLKIVPLTTFGEGVIPLVKKIHDL